MQLSQEDPGKNEGRYNCNLTLTVYPQQHVMLTPKDVAELGRKDMVQLWKVHTSAWPDAILQLLVCFRMCTSSPWVCARAALSTQRGSGLFMSAGVALVTCTVAERNCRSFKTVHMGF